MLDQKDKLTGILTVGNFVLRPTLRYPQKASAEAPITPISAEMDKSHGE